jgi:hypothetical protein
MLLLLLHCRLLRARQAAESAPFFDAAVNAVLMRTSLLQSLE